MVFLQIAGGETFKRVKKEHFNRRGHIDLSVGNHPIALGHKPQLDRLLDILTGITTGDPEKRPKVSDPTLLIWRHQLRKCENGKPVGEPLDLTKSTRELGLKPAEVLYLEYAPVEEPDPVHRMDTNNSTRRVPHWLEGHEMRHREDTLAAERKQALETPASASPSHSAADPAPAAVPPELLAAITSLQSDNKELRGLLHDLKSELATRSTPAPAAPAAPGPSADALPRLDVKVRRIINTAGLAHYAEIFCEHQMDEAALRRATKGELPDLGLSPDEQASLLAVLRREPGERGHQDHCCLCS